MMFFTPPPLPTPTPQYAQYLRDLVQKASECDPQRTVFGSSKHNYHLNPTVSVAEVEEYQSKHQVRLPSEYVFFITQVGNGGAGPYYGIKPLNLTAPCYLSCSKPPFISSHLTNQQWKEKLAPFLDDDMEDYLYDQIEGEILQNVFELGTQGCCYDNITLMNCPDENRIFYLNSDWNPDCPPYDTKISFLQWYETFFKEIISGNSVASYGSLPIASAEELMQQFFKTDNFHIQKSILSSFYRFPSQSESVLNFFRTLPDPLFTRYKLAFLFKYDTENILQQYPYYLQHFPYPAIESGYALPKESLGSFYTDFLNLLYHPCRLPPLSEKEFSTYLDRLLCRISECPQFCCKDILDFIQQKNISDAALCAALFAMKKASPQDRLCHIETFRHFLLYGSDEVVYYSLQAVSSLYCPELNPTYLILWERYQKAECMHSVLKIAFQTNQLSIPT